jgi:hypothetical protein
MPHRRDFVPHLGHHVTFIHRDLLRRKTGHGRKFSIPRHLKGAGVGVPTVNVPQTFDWRQTKSGTLELPIMGNDQVGDCYYAAAVHLTQIWTGNVGQEASFDAAKVVARYLKLSGGDNGLGDDQILPEFKAGIVGPRGPYAILDDLTVDPNDDASIALAMYVFGGVFYTAALLNTWLKVMEPGAVWNADGSPDPTAGHAMVISGRNNRGNYLDQTWGFNPPVELTPAGLKHSDPEIVVCFSPLWFNPSTGYAPNGLHYTDAAAIWTHCGGHPLPPWKGPAPNPNPNPNPTPTPIPAPSPSQLRAIIDAAFAALEKKYPKLRPTLIKVQAMIDAYLNIPSNLVKHCASECDLSGPVPPVSEWRVCSGMDLSAPLPPQVVQIIDAVFTAVEGALTGAGKPLLAEAVQVVQYLLDQYFASQAKS